MIKKQVQRFLKNNLSAILFFGLIFFGVASFIVKNSQETSYAKEIVDYAENSVPKLRTKFAEISKASQSLSNEDASYEILFNNLDNFQKTVTDLAASVPSKSGDTDTRKTEQGLKDFILTVNDENIKAIKTEYQARKEIRPSQETYADIKTVATSNNSTKADLDKVYQAGLRVLDFNKTIEKNTKNLQLQATLKSNNDAEQQILDQVKVTLDSAGDNLNQAQRNAIVGIYTAGWPVKPLLFTALQQSALETDSFISNIKQLQQLVTTLRQKFSL